MEQKARFWKRVKKYRFIYAMMLPVILYYLVFSYVPLILGVITSFQKTRMIGAPAFAGPANYAAVLKSPVYGEAFRNSLAIGAGTFLVQFPLGLLIALALNEAGSRFSKSLVQSISFIPNLLSWTVVGGMWLSMLAPAGLVNQIARAVSGGSAPAVIFMSEQRYAQPIMVLSGAWKGAGYYAVLFLAAITGINPSVYEAAAIDGASRLRQIGTIILPSLRPTMQVVTLLAAMGVLRNFDQIYVMGNASIYPKVRTLLYLIYQDGIVDFKTGQATAAATLILAATFLFTFLTRRATGYDASYT